MADDLPLRFRAVLESGVKLDAPLARECRRLLAELEKPRGTGRGLYLWGPTGSGKTLAACSLVFRLRERNEKRRAAAEAAYQKAAAGSGYPRAEFTRAAFVTDRDLIRRAREAMGEGPSFGRFLEGVVRGDLLVLDDLASGTETPYTEWEAGLLGEAVDLAYREGVLVVVTSNKDLPAVARILGARVSSRLAELCEVVEYRAPDRRLGKA